MMLLLRSRRDQILGAYAPGPSRTRTPQQRFAVGIDHLARTKYQRHAYDVLAQTPQPGAQIRREQIVLQEAV
jgi:hypothetical protein